MKCISVFLTSLLVALSSFANDGVHFEYDGIPIDGTLDSFLVRSKNHGYQLLEYTPRTLLLSGLYQEKVCRVLVESLPTTDTVWGLTVLFPSCMDWSRLLTDYKELKTTFKELYGEPVYNIEFFNSSFQPKTDIERIEALKSGHCSYKTVFESDYGQLDVVIWSDVINGCYVLVSFIDKKNSLLLP